MSIFGKIMSTIFGGPAAANPAPSSGPAATLGGAGPPVQSTPSPTAMSKVDVAAVMDRLADDADEELDWRISIVDLMKLLKLDSSLNTRRQLADELKFTGDKKDTATMNVWLHKQVMAKLAENGGKVPAGLLKR